MKRWADPEEKIKVLYRVVDEIFVISWSKTLCFSPLVIDYELTELSFTS